MAHSGSQLPPYINGRFVTVGKPERTFQALNPAKPSDLLAVTGWRKDLVSEIVDGMRVAQRAFQVQDFASRLALVERFVSYLRESSEEIKSHMMLELARSRVAVEEEWRLCEDLFSILPRFCAEALAEKDDKSGWVWSYAPVGLVLVSSNVALPIYSILSTALPALVAGNAVCIRPSLHTPLSTSLLASGFHQTPFPAGLVQVVYGDLEVYRRLILTHQFDTVLYSGGEETLEQIRRDLSTNQNTRLVLCSGGKNAALVTSSANIDEAVGRILYGAFVDCGQRLEATGLAFVHERVMAEFTDKFVQAVKLLPIGVRNDLSASGAHVMGPLCSAASWERFLRFQGIAAREADETLRWGKPIDNPGNGYFVSPGVHLMQPEKVRKSVYAGNAFFGPDVALVPVRSTEEAIALLDDLAAARCLAVHTAYEEELRTIRKISNVPTISWNCATTTLEPQLPTIGRGRAGNSYVSGVRFLFSTVFPKTLNLKSGQNTVEAAEPKTGKKEAGLITGGLPAILLCLLGATMAALFGPLPSARADYRKAVEGNEVVKGKLYPRSGRFQINAVQGGAILNQSFLKSFLYTLSATYHINEWHAVNVEGLIGFTKDSFERKCVENFYYEPDKAKGAGATDACDPDNLTDPNGGGAKDDQGRAPFHRKPAYMPIRQIDQVVGVNYQWTPVYGKALYFLSAVGYLDVYTTVGLGLTMSTYWPLKDKLDNGQDIAAVGTNDATLYGANGRPLPLKESSPTFSLGLGNRFFFARNFLVNLELRNFTVFGSNGTGGSDWMNFVAIWGGLGLIF